jgi:ABC-2 type transport system permease protein
MQSQRVRAVLLLEARLMLRDPVPLVVLLVMPLLLMGFLKPALALATVGPADANGAEQAVPGMTVMFASFLVGHVGLAFFREHGWGTWQRVRASSARSVEVMVGKVLASLLLFVAVLGCLLGGGGWLLGLDVRGSLMAFVAVAAAFAVALLGLGLALVAVSRTLAQFSAVANLGGLLLAGLGGALVPLRLLPGWVQTVAPVSPGYWAMRGFTDVALHGRGATAVALPVLVLLLFGGAAGGFAAVRLRFEEDKVGWV